MELVQTRGGAGKLKDCGCRAPNSSGKPVPPRRCEGNLDALVQTLKETDKNDKDRPHLCRAIWRRKRARRRHVDRQKKIECCEEGRAPPVKTKSKHIKWSRVFGEEEVPKALSEFYSSIFEFPTGRRQEKTMGGESVAHAFG